MWTQEELMQIIISVEPTSTYMTCAKSCQAIEATEMTAQRNDVAIEVGIAYFTQTGFSKHLVFFCLLLLL